MLFSNKSNKLVQNDLNLYSVPIAGINTNTIDDQDANVDKLMANWACLINQALTTERTQDFVDPLTPGVVAVTKSADETLCLAEFAGLA